MTKFGISNGKHQRHYRNICKKLSPSKLKAIFEELFEHNLDVILEDMSNKHPSYFSKQVVTVILDDSIFKQWLGMSVENIEKFENFYSYFFSGQCHKAVFGFKVVTLGVSVNEIFHPLYYGFVKANSSKKEKNKLPKTAKNVQKQVLSLAEKASRKAAKIQEKAEKIALKNTNDLQIFSGEKPDSAVSVAIKLVKRFGVWKDKLAQKGTIIPDLHFSCDSGYNHELLERTCENNDLRYIGVVKKPHKFLVNGKPIKASDLIETVFLEKERQHQAKQEHLSKQEKIPFSLRIRANYCAKGNKPVVLLIFRLNGSNKVSMIYTTHLEIMAKTLRRHWFARTYIEQFFKLLKHVLKIQQAITNTKDNFEIKLARFFFVALHAQKLIKIIRKEVKTFAKSGFISLQRILNSERIIIALLQKYTK